MNTADIIDTIRDLAGYLTIIPEDCGNMATLCANAAGDGWERDKLLDMTYNTYWAMCGDEPETEDRPLYTENIVNPRVPCGRYPNDYWTTLTEAIGNATDDADVCHAIHDWTGSLDDGNGISADPNARIILDRINAVADSI